MKNNNSNVSWPVRLACGFLIVISIGLMVFFPKGINITTPKQISMDALVVSSEKVQPVRDEPKSSVSKTNEVRMVTFIIRPQLVAGPVKQ